MHSNIHAIDKGYLGVTKVCLLLHMKYVRLMAHVQEPLKRIQSHYGIRENPLEGILMTLLQRFPSYGS